MKLTFIDTVLLVCVIINGVMALVHKFVHNDTMEALWCLGLAILLYQGIAHKMD